MAQKTVVDDIGARIRSIRKERGLPQEKVAYAARIEQTQLSKIERGVARPSAAVAQRLALALELPEDAFLRDSP